MYRHVCVGGFIEKYDVPSIHTKVGKSVEAFGWVQIWILYCSMENEQTGVVRDNRTCLTRLIFSSVNRIEDMIALAT